MNKSRDVGKYLSSNPIKQKLIGRFLNDLNYWIKALRPKTILDIGCGEGFVDAFLLQKNPHWQIRGIDISKKAIKKAKERVPKLLIQEGDVYHLPFREDTFDLTICLEVLEHLDKPQEAIIEARRVSKKYCLFSAPNEPIFSFLTLLSGVYIRRLGKHPDHLNFWTKNSFRQLVQKHFAKPVKVKISSVWTLVLGEK